MPYLIRFIEGMQVRGALVMGSIVLALTLGLLTKWAGVSLIIGAFAAGLILPAEKKELVFRELKPIADFFVPIFFAIIGASVSFHYLNPFVPENRTILPIALGLAFLAVVGKGLSGFVLVGQGHRVNRLAIGMGMIPRGEVGLIITEVGHTAGVIDDRVFAILVVVVTLTTFVTPVLLRWALLRSEGSAPAPAAASGDNPSKDAFRE